MPPLWVAFRITQSRGEPGRRTYSPPVLVGTMSRSSSRWQSGDLRGASQNVAQTLLSVHTRRPEPSVHRLIPRGRAQTRVSVPHFGRLRSFGSRGAVEDAAIELWQTYKNLKKIRWLTAPESAPARCPSTPSPETSSSPPPAISISMPAARSIRTPVRHRDPSRQPRRKRSCGRRIRQKDPDHGEYGKGRCVLGLRAMFLDDEERRHQ